MTDENIFTYYGRAALTRWPLLLSVIVACTLAAWALSTFVLARNPTFDASVSMNVVPTSEELGYANQFARGQATEGGLILLQTYAEYARARETRTQVVDQYIAMRAKAAGMSERRWLSTQQGPPGFSPGRMLAILNYGEAPDLPLRQQYVEELAEATLIESIDGTYMMQLTVSWDDPRAAAWFANALADAVVQRAQGLSRESGDNIEDVLQAELDRKSEELSQLKNESRELKIGLGVVDVDRQKQSLLDAQLAEQAALTTDRADAQAATARVGALQSQSTGKLGTTQQEIEQALALQRPQAAAARQAIDIRQRRVDKIQSDLERLSRQELRIKSLDDRIAVVTDEVAELTRRTQFSATENLTNIPRIRIVDRAEVPTVRSSPKIFVNTILGFVLGCALAGIILLLMGPKAPKAAHVRRKTDRMDADAPFMGTPPAAPAFAAARTQDATAPPTADPADAPAPVIAPATGRDIGEAAPEDAPAFAMASNDTADGGHSGAAEDADRAAPEPTSFAASGPIPRPRLATDAGSTVAAFSAPVRDSDSDPERDTEQVAMADGGGASGIAAGIGAGIGAGAMAHAAMGSPASARAAVQPMFDADVDADPDPEPEAMPAAPRDLASPHYDHHMLPRPERAPHYTPEQIDAMADDIMRWLSPAIANGMPLSVASLDDPEDARIMAQAIGDVLDHRGIDTRILANANDNRANDGGLIARRLTIIVRGALVDHGRFNAMVAKRSNILLALRQDVRDEAEALARSLETLTGQRPYAAYFHD